MNPRILILCTLTILLLSCSPTKRLQRLIKHHPELTRIDTVNIDTTLAIPAHSFEFGIDNLISVSKDGTFYFPEEAFINDSGKLSRVVFEDNKVRITAQAFKKIISGRNVNSIKFKGEVKEDSVKYQQDIPQQKIINQTESKLSVIYKILGCLALLIALFILYRILLK